MFPTTRSDVGSFCCICLQELSTTSERQPIHDLDTDRNISKWLMFTLHSVLRSPQQYQLVSTYCKRLCDCCYFKACTCCEFRQKTLCSSLAVKELLEERRIREGAIGRLQLFCRICLRRQKSPQAVELTDKLLSWLRECTGVHYLSLKNASEGNAADVNDQSHCDILTVDDAAEFPQQMCTRCYGNLNNYVEFRELAKQSFEYLDRVIGREGRKLHPARALDNRAEQAESNNEVNSSPLGELSNINKVSEKGGKEKSPEWEVDASNSVDRFKIGKKSKKKWIKRISVGRERTVSMADNDNEVTSMINARTKREKKSDNKEKWGLSKRIIKCKQCNKAFLKQIHYEAHVRSTHEGIWRPYYCKQCPKTYRTYHNLTQHIRKYHLQMFDITNNYTISPLPFICDICSRTFKRKENLNVHIRSVHEGLRPHKCCYCEKSFGARKTLRVHEMIHSGVFPYKCGKRGKRLRRLPALKTHAKYHTSLPELLCPICKRAQWSVEALKEHTEKHQPARLPNLKVRPHQCSYCDGTFGLRKTCTVHERLHSSNEREICLICCKTFKQRTELLSHMKMHKKQAPIGRDNTNKRKQLNDDDEI